MTEMRWAYPSEKDEIIDFCDFIFSKFSRPHDFETLLPKLYGKNGNSAPHHFIIREDNRITAAILAYPVEMHIGASRFMTIGVGSVSVHPRSQGRGYMQHMLAAVDEHARDFDAVFSCLGGQRQRYGYFGYQPTGYHMNVYVNKKNAKHALKDVVESNFEIVPMEQYHVSQALDIHQKQLMYCARTQDNFLDVLRSWNCTPCSILKEGRFAGFAVLKPDGKGASVDELQLISEDDMPAVLKKLVSSYGNINLTAASWQTERAKYLTSICEHWEIKKNHMFKVYQEEILRSTLKDAGLSYKSPLAFEAYELPLPLFVSSPDAV